MTRSSLRDLRPIVDNPKALIQEARRNQRRMGANKPTLDSYIQPHLIPLCKTLRLPMGAKFELKPSVLQLLTASLQFGVLSNILWSLLHYANDLVEGVRLK